MMGDATAPQGNVLSLVAFSSGPGATFASGQSKRMPTLCCRGLLCGGVLQRAAAAPRLDHGRAYWHALDSNPYKLSLLSAGLLVAAFCNAPQHRALIMDELVGSVLPHAAPGRATPRAIASLPDSAPPVHAVTSLVLQMLQVRVSI